MDRKTFLQLGEDGLPLDGVSHYAATPGHLSSYEQAAGDLYRFKVPQLLDRADPHSYLIVGLMDGTGNDVYADPVHATNVAKFLDQIEKLQESGLKRIRYEYIEGPGTQDDVLARTLDGATGRTSLARANEMYKRLTRESQEIFQLDPDARIAYHLEGFSRGGSQIPLLTRMIDERGIPDPDGGISGIDENGQPLYNRYHQAPGRTPMSVGLYDPVPTGYMEVFDRRLPPSVVSGFQISAADERRGLFPVDQIIPHGVSEDGRFLHVTVAGAHSDIGGTYLRGGLGVRSLNLMTDYHNGLLSEPMLPRMHEPTDARMNVIHRSEEGNPLFRVLPNVDRATPAGQVHQLTADYARYAQPGEVVHLPLQRPEPLHEALMPLANTARPVQRSPQVADAALTEGDALTARLSRMPGVEVRPYPPPMLDRPGIRTAGALGVAATFYEAQQSGEKIATLLSQDNPLAARSELAHFAGRNVGGWAGGTAAAYALGAAGAGPMALIAADAYVMSKAGEKAADLLDNRAIYHQTDRDGRQWSFNGTAWSREGMADTTNDGVDNPTATPIFASYEKARELNYQATNAAAALALKDAPAPEDPYRLPANATDRPSLSTADWQRDASDGQWHRQVKTEITGANDRGIYAQETATPPRAAELDAQAQQVIARNIANSPGAIAARYELAYQRSGWAAAGLPLSETVQSALPNPDALTASDGHQYRRAADGRWAGEAGTATGNVALELETTRTILQPAVAEHAQAIAAIQQSPPSAQEVQREQTLYRYRIVGTELQPQWREAIELATQRTREAAGLSGDGAMQLQRGPGGQFGADSPIAHLQRGADGVERIAAVTSTEEIRQALSEVQAQGHVRLSSAEVPVQRTTSTAQASEGSTDNNTSSSNASASAQQGLDMQVRMQAAGAAQARQEREQQERQAQEQQAAQARAHALQEQ
ncbi:phospholipase effector Tle1 domain-containing protein, partial [Xanthomonas vasicola]